MAKVGRPGERVALLYVMGGGESEDEMVRIHAAVPYISTLQHVTYPYNRLLVKKEFRNTIEDSMVTLPLEFEEGRQFGSKRMLDVNPRDILDIQLLEEGVPRYLQALRSRSEKLMEALHFEPIVDFLFSLSGQVNLLQIFSDVPDIPWDWFFNETTRKFLCEVFGIGITQPQGENLSNVLFSSRDRSLSRKELRSADCVALVVGNSYPGEPGFLADMDLVIPELGGVVEDTFSSQFTFREDNVTTRELGRKLGEMAAELRLLVLVGHFSNEGYRCKDTYFGPAELSYALEKANAKMFEQHPVVLLNGCQSKGRGLGHLGSQFSYQRSLAQAFLDRGAGACIFTSARVRMNFARRFTVSFLKNLLEPGASLGGALLEARATLDKGECYEWAVYHLLGDPSYVMVRDEEA